MATEIQQLPRLLRHSMVIAVVVALHCPIFVSLSTPDLSTGTIMIMIMIICLKTLAKELRSLFKQFIYRCAVKKICWGSKKICDHLFFQLLPCVWRCYDLQTHSLYYGKELAFLLRLVEPVECFGAANDSPNLTWRYVTF